MQIAVGAGTSNLASVASTDRIAARSAGRAVRPLRGSTPAGSTVSTRVRQVCEMSAKKVGPLRPSRRRTVREPECRSLVQVSPSS